MRSIITILFMLIASSSFAFWHGIAISPGTILTDTSTQLLTDTSTQLLVTP